MKHLSLFLAILFSLGVNAQDVSKHIENLTLDEVLRIDSGVEAKDITISKDDAIQENTINIGLLLPYSLYGIFSKEIEDAVQLAFDEINDAGGVRSQNLRIIPADDAGNIIESVKMANTLVEDYKISALIGPTGSSRLIQVATKVTIPNHICLMSSGSSSSLVSLLEDDNLVWRVTPIDVQEASFASKFIVNNLNKKRVGVIYIDNHFGKSLHQNLVANLGNKGGEVVASLAYKNIEQLQSDVYKNKLNSFFGNDIEVVYLIATPFEGHLVTEFFEDARLLDPDQYPVFFSSSSNKGNIYLYNSSEMIMDNIYGITQKISLEQDFIENFESKYGYTPTTPEASGAYDIAYLLAYSMLYAKSTNSEDFVKYLPRITSGRRNVGINDFKRASRLIRWKRDFSYKGASGQIKFDEKGDLANPEFEFWKLRNNEYEVIK